MKVAVLSTSPGFSPYPWSSLESLPRRAVKSLAALRRHNRIAELTANLCGAFERWSGQPTRYELVRVTPSGQEPQEPRPRLLLRCAAFPVSLLVCLDPRLCLKITQRLAKQPDTLLDPLPPIEAPLLGAVAALVSHLLDDAALDTPVRIGWGHLPESTGQRATFEGILHWGQGSYELVLVFDLPWAPTQERVPPVDLAVLGDLPLSPRLRIGQSRLSTAELGRITVGAVFLPGPDLWLDSEGRGQGYLVAPEGDWSYPCNLVDGGRIVLGAHAVNRDIDAPDPKEASTNCARGSKTTSAKSLADVLAETPLTVQIELGVVTLPAREFARLLPGDVIETQSNLGEPVTLRIAGRAVASAELVNIEGQLGLRIRELFTGELR